MARTAGIVLVLLAGASIALGSPLCCVLGANCCGSSAVAQASGKSHEGCCSHCRKEQPGKPAPRPCEGEKDCFCKHDTTTHHASSAEHAPLVAILDVAAAALPARAAAEMAAPSVRTPRVPPASRSQPLLL
ncbi:MAG TPA: hypothetical protein VFY93_09845 [Planctomycetota bacterium]|nr:hypothetical protein [Planctomycetota bacterium]